MTPAEATNELQRAGYRVISLDNALDVETRAGEYVTRLDCTHDRVSETSVRSLVERAMQ